jgi:hypothetical protein
MRRALLAAVFLLSLAPAALAGNDQIGDNTGSSSQDGSSASGDAVAGPSAAFSSRGDLRVRMTNRAGSDDEIRAEDLGPGLVNVQGPTKVASGRASAGNSSSLFVGLDVGSRSSDALSDLLLAPLDD